MNTMAFQQKAFYFSVRNIIENLVYHAECCDLNTAIAKRSSEALIAVGNQLIAKKSYTIYDFSDVSADRNFYPSNRRAEYAIASESIKYQFQDAVSIQKFR